MYPLQVAVTGPASLSASSALTTGTCEATGSTDGTLGCVFSVYTTGEAGEFSVRASAATGRLTDASINAPKTIKGQWVGPAVSVEVLKKAPANTAVELDGDGDGTNDATLTEVFGSVSPSALVGGFTAGLLGTKDASGTARTPSQAGFLFQLKDSAGQAVLALAASDRAAPRLRIITDSADKDVTLKFVRGLSIPAVAATPPNLAADAKSVYAAIGDESTLGTLYPARDSAVNTGTGTDAVRDPSGLIAVALDPSTVARGKAALGRIMVDLSGGNTFEHAIAIAGDPNGGHVLRQRGRHPGAPGAR